MHSIAFKIQKKNVRQVNGDKEDNGVAEIYVFILEVFMLFWLPFLNNLVRGGGDLAQFFKKMELHGKACLVFQMLVCLVCW